MIGDIRLVLSKPMRPWADALVCRVGRSGLRAMESSVRNRLIGDVAGELLGALDDTNTFLNLMWASWPQGAGLFALGVWAGEAGSLDDLTAWARQLGWIALAATAVMVAIAVYEQARGQAGSALHGAGWPVMFGVVRYGIVSVAVTVWFTALIRARWSGDGPIRARAGRASYAAYVLHPPLLTAIMVLFASLALAPELKFLVVAVVAVPVCFLAGYAATRVPAISKVL